MLSMIQITVMLEHAYPFISDHLHLRPKRLENAYPFATDHLYTDNRGSSIPTPLPLTTFTTNHS